MNGGVSMKVITVSHYTCPHDTNDGS